MWLRRTAGAVRSLRSLGCMRVSVATQTKGINRHFTREAVLMAVWVVVPLALGLVVALVGPWLVAGLR